MGNNQYHICTCGNPHRLGLNLTERELEILTEVAHGFTQAQAAATLDIRPTTVKTTLSTINGKMDVQNAIAAATKAIALGWITLDLDRIKGYDPEKYRPDLYPRKKQEEQEE